MIQRNILRPTLSLARYEMIDDRYNPFPMLIDQYNRIIDGHHKWYAHLKYGQRVNVERVVLSPIQELDLEAMITTLPKTEYNMNDPENVFWLHNTPVTVRRDNGRYVVVLGNSIVHELRERGYRQVQSHMVV